VKRNVILILMLISLLGCSAKNSARKNGAILGTTAGVLAGGVMGVAIAGQKSGRSTRFTEGAIIGALIIGSLGYLAGSTMGYVIDEVKDKKEVEELSSTQAIVGKHMKEDKPMLSSPESINEDILNATSQRDTISNSTLENDIYVNEVEKIKLEEKEVKSMQDEMY